MNPTYNGDYHFTNGVGQGGQSQREYQPRIPNGHHVTASTSPAQRARHPEYADRNERFFTFVHWRIPQVQDPTLLVNYGFFYTGQGDLVRCYHCSIGLKDFIASDDPLLEHIRYAGDDCGHLVELFGPSRLQEIKTELRNERGQHIPHIHESERHYVQRHNEPPRHNGRNENNQDRLPNGQLQTQANGQSNYRHPEYSNHSIRVASYTGWPAHLVQTPQKLADAGFYFTGTRDVVRCYSCDGGLQKWDPTDDPWIEHCINFPECRHLKETKGDSYIKLASTQRRQQTESNTNGSVAETFNNLRIRDNHNGTPNGSTLEGAKIQIVGMGYPMDDVNRAVDTLYKEHKETTIDNIIDELERQRNEEVQNPKDVLKEHKKLKAQLFCMECKTADINSLFLPCQHHRLCTNCSASLSQCPVCGSDIVQRIKTYRP